MRYVQDSPLELGYRVWKLQPPQWSMTVVAKGTFDVRPDAPAAFAEEQSPVTGELYLDDDVERPLRAPSDLALVKPRGEALLIGHAHAPGAGAKALSCRFVVGPIEKRFAIFGDRHWTRKLVASISEPTPFTTMELNMTRAYGGPGYAKNPYGRGREAVTDEAGVAQVWLPNIERPGRLVDSPNASPDPVVVGPLPVMWPARMALGGTYDGAYAKTRWPWFPVDFDPAFFMESPPDQWLAEGFFRGDERVELEGLHPEHAFLKTCLPGIAPRVLIDLTRPEREAAFEEVPLRLDTVVWDGESAKLCCVWRGRLDVPSETLEEVRYVYVAHDPLAGPHRPFEALVERCGAVLEAEEADEVEAEGEAPPSLDDPIDEAATVEMEPYEQADDEGEASAAAPEEDEAAGALAALEAQLAAMNIPVIGDAPEQAKRATAREMLEAMRASGAELPPGLEALVAESEAAEAGPDPTNEELPDDPDDPLEGRALVQARLAEGLDLRELDLSHADLSGLDLSRQDLQGTVLSGANLSGANLSQARVRDCALVDAVLERASLAGADAGEADFTGADLRGADLVNANIEGADFTDAKMISARLAGARASVAIFGGADLSGSTLSRADFREADFEGANLTGVDATESNFTDATLEGVTADRARFDSSVMVQVRAEGLRAEDARFAAVLADDSFWERAHLVRAHFSGSRLSRADFSDAVLMSAQLDQCVLREARFDRANAHSVQARRADLFEASLEGANLGFADLRGANLFGANLFEADLADANLELADVAMTLLVT